MQKQERLPQSIDEYLQELPPERRAILVQIREIIRQEAPMATEAIRYGLPTFVLKGNLIHFGAMKRHVGFYPSPACLEAFSLQLVDYATSKGAVQFPYHRAVPFDLIRRMVTWRVNQALGR